MLLAVGCTFHSARSAKRIRTMLPQQNQRSAVVWACWAKCSHHICRRAFLPSPPLPDLSSLSRLSSGIQLRSHRRNPRPHPWKDASSSCSRRHPPSHVLPSRCNRKNPLPAPSTPPDPSRCAAAVVVSAERNRERCDENVNGGPNRSPST